MKYLVALFWVLISSVAESSEWTFVTPYAQEFRYSYDVKKKMYRFSTADIIENLESCESAELEVCIISNDLDFAIPRRPINVGDQWSVLGTKFEYVRLLPELNFWGNAQKNVMVINVVRDQNYYLNIHKVKRSTHAYSRESGLLFSLDEEDNVPLIAASLPSIGARPR